MSNPKSSSKPKPERQVEEKQEGAPPKDKKPVRCYTFPWSRSRGGGILLIIALAITFLIYKGVSTSINKPESTAVIILTEGQRPRTQPTVFEIPAGTGWSAPIFYTGQSALQYKFLTDVETQVRAYADGTYNPSTQTYAYGRWKNPVPDGPSHYNVVYFEGTTKMSWERLSVPYRIIVYWQ